MRKINEKEAVALLKKYSYDPVSFNNVLKHVRAVRKVALKIAKDVPGVDKEFISTASLLHDIGRFDCYKTKVIRHGLIGAMILRQEGLPKYALVAERHLGAGISKEDIKIQSLNLPLKDYLPITKEERIITHADNLIKGIKEISIKEAVKRFEKELGKKAAHKIQKLAQEVEEMRVK